MHEILTRRQALRAAGVVGLSVTAGGLILMGDEAKRGTIVTPAQTSGPFYPRPEIEKQPFHDTDLVRKMKSDEPAKGEIVVINGAVKDVTGRPIPNAVVEIWQACASGRYNHSRDSNKAMLDEKFQYWGRVSTGKDGAYAFRTIKPGEYPGRTAHVHYRVLAPGFRGVVTQMYFADRARANAKDFIYDSLDRAGRDALTVGFAKGTGDKEPKGTFDVILAAK